MTEESKVELADQRTRSEKLEDNTGYWITLVYMGCLIGMMIWRWKELTCLPLNELGDFAAGAFGPLAILWLVMGYRQQGKELKLNTQALTHQVKELNASVQQQQEMVAINKEVMAFEKQKTAEEQQRSNHAIQPSFELFGEMISADAVEIEWKLQVINHGERCTMFSIYMHPERPIPSVQIANFPAGDLKNFDTNSLIELGDYPPFQIHYTDLHGNLNVREGFYQIFLEDLTEPLQYKIRFSYLSKGTKKF